MKLDLTNRGFGIYEFKDRYDSTCSLQESSLATESCVWFGVDDANPIILTDYGWKPYEIPEEVLLTTRMHLTQEQVRKLLPILQNFVDTGNIEFERSDENE